MTPPLLRLHDLGIGYRQGGRDIIVAAHIEAQLPAGRFVCLIGRNGSGKSTLLRTMAGLQPALSGEVRLSDRVLTALPAEEVSRSVGIVLTHQTELLHTTVAELVSYGRLPYSGFWGHLTVEDHRKAAEALNQVGIATLADRNLTTLSDGERQKVMIAKTLAQETTAILLDEPSAFLDFTSKRELMTLLSDLAHKHHKAILLSTHDVEMAQNQADELWLIDNHRLHTMSPSDLDLATF